MTLKKLRQLYGQFRKYPFYFMDYPEANVLIDAIPTLLDIAEAVSDPNLEPSDVPGQLEHEAWKKLQAAIAVLESTDEPDDGGRGL